MNGYRGKTVNNAKTGVFTMLAYSYIRFSTLEQRNGNSLIRQIEMRDAYLQEKGLTLDNSLTLPPDLGKSGHDGTNVKRGSLGLFLEALEDGRIQAGSVLIVENLDRLTRQDPDKAIRLFLDVLDRGVTIVTLKPRYEFSKPVNMMDLFQATIELCRGHGESARKSDLSTDNWNKIREKIRQGEKLNTRVPSWIDKKTWSLIQEKADVVNLIFQLSEQGYGFTSIAKKLTEDGIPTISKDKIWRNSYVEKILKNRSVLGEYQPKTKVDGKRIPIGEPVKDYYPPVISQEQWDATHRSIQSRKYKRGRISRGVSNVFTGLLWMDSERLSFRKQKRAGYLLNESSTSMPIRYSHFETSILLFLKEASITIGGNKEYELLANQKQDLEQRYKTLKEKIATNPDLEDLLDTLAEIKSKLKETESKLNLATIPTQAHAIHTKQLLEMMDSASDSELEKIRRQLKHNLSMIIERIDVSVEGRLRQEKVIEARILFRNSHDVRTIYYVENKDKLLKVVSDFDCPDDGNLQMHLDSFENQKQASLLFCSQPDDSRKNEVIKLREQGLSVIQIAEKFKVHRVTVYKWLK